MGSNISKIPILDCYISPIHPEVPMDGFAPKLVLG